MGDRRLAALLCGSSDLEEHALAIRSKTPDQGTEIPVLSLRVSSGREYPSTVLLPNAERAVVDEAKVRDYLLCTSHPVGRFKAVFFSALGFSVDQWETLRDGLLDMARSGAATPGQPSPFGQKFEIRATLVGPSGRQAPIVTVWLVAHGRDFPHFVTAFPG